MKLLLENWRAYYKEDFVVLCESYEQGAITEERLLILWEDNVDREYQQLLNEGIMDILAIGYEKSKELIGKAKETYDKAIAKISEFYMKLLNQAWLLTQKVKQGLSKIASVLKGVYQRINAFCDKHPIICKIVKLLIMMLAVAAVMSLFSSEAQAAIDISGVAGQPEGAKLSDAGVNAVKGLMQMASEDKDPQVQQKMVDAYNWLEQAHASQNLEQLSTAQGVGAEKVKLALEIITDIIKEQPDRNVIGEFAKLGEKVYVNTTRYTETINIQGDATFKSIEWQSLKVR